jgi:hypothetical protein
MPIFTDQLITSNTQPAQTTTSGALQIAGGAGIAGTLIAKRMYTVDGLYWFGNSAAFGGSTTRNTGLTSPQGATGPQGPPGATGAMGATGVSGKGGQDGIPGTTGATGAPGATGAVGATGLTGATGPANKAGATGPKGATGAPGFAAKLGATGDAGPQGQMGSTGPTGETGPMGDTGDPGGATGDTGDTGYWTYTEVTRKYVAVGGELTLTFNTDYCNYYINGLTSDLTPKFMALPPLNTALGASYGQTLVFVLSVQQSASPHTISNIKIGTATQTVRWLNNTPPVGDANRLDVFSFCCLQLTSQTWVVTGQCATYG